jgi:hypothetical protein
MVLCAAAVVMVRVAEATVIGPCPVIDAELHVASTGKPLHDNVMAVVKPVDAIMPTVLVPLVPGALMLTFVGPDTNAKPGCTVNVTGLVLLLAVKLGSPP